MLGQAAEFGSVHDFRRVLDCVPGQHVTPGLYMKSVAIASMWTRGGEADVRVRVRVRVRVTLTLTLTLTLPLTLTLNPNPTLSLTPNPNPNP